MVDVVIHHLDEGQVVASCGPLLMRIVETTPTRLVDLRRIGRLFDELAREHERVGLMIVVHHGAPIPSTQVLREMGEMSAPIREHGAAVFVMLGLGFWSMAAHRSIRMLTNFARVRTPVETDLDRAARWISDRTPGLTPTIVTSAYENAASKMTVRPSRSGTTRS